MISPAVSAQDVCFKYQEGTRALDRVNFHADPGEFVAMLASNGSGKTTLIKVLIGLLKPEKGKVVIHGKDLSRIAKKDLFQTVGLVLQNPVDQLFAATVEEDVAYGPRNLGFEEDEVQRRVGEALACVAASELRHRAIHHLSYGEQKRVSMAGVLAMNPSILILDEPTAGLDPAGETLMMRLLNKLNREQGITIILATHNVDLLPLFADRIYVLQRGRVLKQGPSDEIFCEHEMIRDACLRLPYIATLLHKLKQHDGVPIAGLPLTIGEARSRLLELIPDNLIVKQPEVPQ
ncbi:energy-coupling factor ABC transporter ATP-binding protein [Desulfomonile tiedjei]|uniref:ABC transporter ATP-binding protein n=1 Tax=Desulfomonile tiedjei (strain ATCC 49306 / DSM 6799 / DCB-1) TaxID=706587 RepID=I4CF38_DESTA|nr:ATP-binding cassette domain-containing protein [Desulfomonile tiedjei]AFM28179.1 cobalt transport protein ATP-binding subunit [Desulfomonile tiedjei DSM 6799]